MGIMDKRNVSSVFGKFWDNDRKPSPLYLSSHLDNDVIGPRLMGKGANVGS